MWSEVHLLSFGKNAAYLYDDQRNEIGCKNIFKALPRPATAPSIDQFLIVPITVKNELDTDVRLQNSACADALSLLTTYTR